MGSDTSQSKVEGTEIVAGRSLLEMGGISGTGASEDLVGKDIGVIENMFVSPGLYRCR